MRNFSKADLRLKKVIKVKDRLNPKSLEHSQLNLAYLVPSDS